MAQTPYGVPIRSEQIENSAINESSGLAASRLDPDVLWTFNDSGAPPLLFALGKNGEDRGTFRVKGAKNRDWEDIAAFQKNGVPYLLIADVGDNQAKWPWVAVYVVREPQTSSPTPANPISIQVAWTIRFQYEDGPRDCEAVAVDETAGKILLLTKRDIPPVLYTLSLDPGDDSVRMAWKDGEAVGLPKPNIVELGAGPLLGGYADMVTAMDVSQDGARALVLTYKNAYLFDRSPGTSWIEVFSSQPRSMNLPTLPQAEGACFARDGQTIFVSSEKLPASLLQINANTAF